MLKKRLGSIVGLALLLSFYALGQECSSTIILKLKNYKGGVYSNQRITLISRVDKVTFEQVTDDKGEATFSLPCNTVFDVSIPNYTKKVEVQTQNGGYLKRTLNYEPDMAQKDKEFEMTEEEKLAVDMTASSLPDSVALKGFSMLPPKSYEHFVKISIRISDFNNKPIAGEELLFKGLKRNKKIAVKTDYNGKVLLYVPKGDEYTLSFKYHKDYSKEQYKYTKGTSSADLRISYLGTKEIERRKKVEELRIAELEKRERELRRKFEEECKKRKITIEEGYKLKLDKINLDDNSDSVILTALNRNSWAEKLIVCDLTGSMQPYWVQLAIWYQLNYMKEKNLQFVFFNDGDEMDDSKKIIGNTGGIYYSESKGIDSLGMLMSRVAAKGSGGDCPENNLEALIKGVAMAKPFKELVMIVDNNSPVKDIKLLKDFNKPVHIILCGSSNGWVLPDYLLIAWRTKGTIHTIEQDIKDIARLSEGQEFSIGKNKYRLMGGEFINITPE